MTGSPSPNSSYDKLWALGSKHAVAGPSVDTISASHTVLDSLRQRRGAETAAWLNSLIGPTQTTSTENNIQPVAEEQERQLIQWVDKLFDQFDLYAARFNNTAQGTDLVVSSSRPNMAEPEIIQPDQISAGFTAPEKIYAGHLVTRFWAMLLRGTVSAINVYIIPSEVLLGFSLHKIDETVYNPLLVIQSCWKDGQFSWNIDGTCIVRDQIPLLAKELFGDLIRVASGQMSESELFAHSTQNVSLGEHLAVGYKMPPASDPSTLNSAAMINQSVPVVQSASVALQITNSAEAPIVDANINWATLTFGERMLAAIDNDINQLILLGKNALSAEDKSTFQRIKLLTEKLDVLKQNIKMSLNEISQLTVPPEQTK